MMSELWTEWIPIEGLGTHYTLELLRDGADGFEILLANMGNAREEIKIQWKWCAEAYVREPRALCSELALAGGNGQVANASLQWSFFRVKRSNYLRQLAEESCGISEVYGVEHYVIITKDSVIHVGATGGPVVTRLVDGRGAGFMKY